IHAVGDSSEDLGGLSDLAGTGAVDLHQLRTEVCEPPARSERHAMIELAQIKNAAAKIKTHVRRTPLWRLTNAAGRDGLPYELFLKLELLQVTGSFKPRGAFNRTLTEPGTVRGLVTSSGGNHGIAVAYVGKML